MILQFPSSKQSRTSSHTNQTLGVEYPDLKELLLELNYSKRMTLLGIYSQVFKSIYLHIFAHIMLGKEEWFNGV